MANHTSSGSYHHGDLKNALLQAGEQLLAEKGITAVSLRDVARAAGVSHTAPYRHFRNKAALLRALALTGFVRLNGELAEVHVREKFGPERQLAETAVGYVRFAMTNPEMFRLMFGEMVTADGDAEYLAASQAVLAWLDEIMRAGIAVGVFRDRDAGELAQVAWTSMHGLATLLMSGAMGISVADREQPGKLVRVVMQHIIYGLSR
jgi:AcrR family transcriptional regulator